MENKLIRKKAMNRIPELPVIWAEGNTEEEWEADVQRQISEFQREHMPIISEPQQENSGKQADIASEDTTKKKKQKTETAPEEAEALI